MGTGSRFIQANQKMLLGFQDLSTRGFTALRQSQIESVLARWDVDGVFNTLLAMNSPANDTIQVIGSSRATDGLGHIMNIQQAYTYRAKIENVNGAVYGVGLKYVEVPGGLRINPRTGKPQFDSWVEDIGRSGTPNAVTDNGNGTITFDIDGITESAVSNAGRVVRVWKVVPGDGATTMQIAVEECAVFWTGGNKITTVGKFGQTTISTTPSDYIVCLMGPVVSRNDPSFLLEAGVVVIGTTTGTGAGNPPGSFTQTGQQLLKTFQDASQVEYTPSGWLAPGATNVQLALDAIVSGLGNSVSTGASGAAKVGVYATAFDTIAAGGLGSTADSTYTTSAKVSDVLIGINAMARRRQTFQTKNDSNGASQPADDVSSVDLANQVATSRPQWLRTLANAGSAPYTLNTDVGVGAGQGSYLMGEFHDPTQANVQLRKTAIKFGGAGSSRAVSFGHWQRVWLDTVSSMNMRFGGTSNVQAQILEDFGANGTHILMDANITPTAVDGPLNWRNGVIKPIGTTAGAAASIQYGISNTGWVWQVMEKLLVYGNDSGQIGGSLSGAIVVNSQLDATLTASTVSAQGRPLVYRDCVFIMQNTSGTGLVQIQGTQQITFENCKFFDIAGRANAQACFFVGTNNAQVKLKNCVIFSPEGNAFSCTSSSCNVVVEDCAIIAGIGGSSATANPTAINVSSSDTPCPVTFRDVRVHLGTSAFRTTGSPTPICGFYGTVNVVENLCIKVDSTLTDLGFARILDIQVNSQTGQGCMGAFSNITVDCSLVKLHSSSPHPPIYFTAGTADSSRLSINRFLLRNTQINVTGAARPWVQLGNGVNGQDWILVSSTNAPTNKMAALLLYLGNNNTIRDLMIGRARYGMATNQGTVMIVGNNNKLVGLKGDENFNTGIGTATASVLFVQGNHNLVSEVDVSLGSDSASFAYFDGRDNALTFSTIIANNNATQIPVRFVSGRRNRFVNNNIHYNGTSNVGLDMTGSLDSIADASTFYRNAGASVGWLNGSAGSVTGTTMILSTTL